MLFHDAVPFVAVGTLESKSIEFRETVHSPPACFQKEKVRSLLPASSCPPFLAEAQVLYQASECGICGERICNFTCVFART
jgi:hypothetical protein